MRFIFIVVLAVLVRATIARVSTSNVVDVTWKPVRRNTPQKQCRDACPGTWTALSAAEWVKVANPGWNVGNTLDAVPDEGSWNAPKLQEATLDDVKKAGFKAIRLPVTYTDHFTSSSPDWIIDSAWLQRVSDVVDMATSRGLHVLTNMHHDSWGWADTSQPNANITMIQEKFYRSWLQIGKKLACKSSMVAFEPLNEPAGSSEADAANLMKLNEIFLQALTDSGGFNSKRVVTLSGLGMSSTNSYAPMFVRPKHIPNPWAFQYHYYSPYDFDFQAWGKTIWGSEADKAAVVSDLSAVRGNFTDIPIIMGEYSASQLNCEAAARWKWYDHVVRTATSLDIGSFLWDNGLDNLQREAGIWRDQIAVDIIMSTVKGQTNSLADSTTDPNALKQETSAYIFHRVGEDVVDTSLPFLLNGNTFASLTIGGTALKAGEDYSISGSNLTFHQSFLEQYISPAATPGSKTNITINFSSGAPSQVEIIQWDLPTLAQYNASASVVPSGSDLLIPIVWKGLHQVAAVKITDSDGKYLFDDWTMWLPELQKGRGTKGSQWSFDFDHLTITSSALQTVEASGKTATFMFEFYPRAVGHGNYLNFTVTP